jgi:hypothetical protein
MAQLMRIILLAEIEGACLPEELLHRVERSMA